MNFTCGVFVRTTVVNLRLEKYDVYIGRGSSSHEPFGNPVARGKPCPVCSDVHQSPGATLTCFRAYFTERLANDLPFRRRVESLRGKRLGCFCKPGPCHGDIIASWLDDRDDGHKSTDS